MHNFKVEATKFTLVGVANFLLTMAVFTVLLKVLGFNYLLSLAISWFFGMCFSYTLNYSWVFRPEEKIQFKERFMKFFFAGLLSLVLNMWILKLIVINSNFDPYWIQMTLIPLIVVFNFSTAKYWSLRPPNVK